MRCPENPKLVETPAHDSSLGEQEPCNFMLWELQLGLYPAKSWRQGHPKPWEQSHQSLGDPNLASVRPESRNSSPGGLKGRGLNQRLFFSRKLLDFLGTCYPFPLTYFSLLEWECPSYTCPTIVFLEAYNLFDLQFHSWKGICLRVNFTLSLNMPDLDDI